MDLDFFISQLTNHSEAIHNLTVDISPEQARWRPDLGSWSILEVINHLFDEECLDFRVRLNLILNHPDQSWPPIDPKGWVIERGYNQRDLAPSVDNFLKERQKSIAWLKGLDNPDWQACVKVPFGEFSAGDIFAAWVAHDLLHLRQLVELHWFFLIQAAGPFRVDYAGEW